MLGSITTTMQLINRIRNTMPRLEGSTLMEVKKNNCAELISPFKGIIKHRNQAIKHNENNVDIIPV
jgi:hypothetical protein